MTLTKQTKFVLAIVLQLAVIFGIIIYKTSILTSGTDIVLKTQPVDPRDFLRGDYVSLRYEISHLDLSKIEAKSEDIFKNGDQIYVELEKTNEYFSAKRISKNKPRSKYFIRGRVASSSDNSLTVVYGTESYFVPEGSGKNLEALLRSRSAEEVVLIGLKVDASGDALINKIRIGAEEIDAFNFKKVEAEARVVYEIETEKRNQEHYQSQEISAKQDRNKKRHDDMERIKSALNFYYYAGGVKMHLASENMPKKIDQPSNVGAVAFFEVPSDPLTKEPYIWIDNTKTPSDYCFYAILETSPMTYYVASSNSETINSTSTIPQTLEDCGIKKSIATLGGHVFFDKNGNGILDKGDTLFKDIILSLAKLKDGLTESKSPNDFMIVGKGIKPDENGYFEFNIFEQGYYWIYPTPTTATRVLFGGVSGVNSSYVQIKGGEEITSYNIIAVLK